MLEATRSGTSAFAVSLRLSFQSCDCVQFLGEGEAAEARPGSSRAPPGRRYWIGQTSRICSTASDQRKEPPPAPEGRPLVRPDLPLERQGDHDPAPPRALTMDVEQGKDEAFVVMDPITVDADVADARSARGLPRDRPHRGRLSHRHDGPARDTWI